MSDNPRCPVCKCKMTKRHGFPDGVFFVCGLCGLYSCGDQSDLKAAVESLIGEKIPLHHRMPSPN